MQEDKNGFLTFLSRSILLHVRFLLEKLVFEYMQGIGVSFSFVFTFTCTQGVREEGVHRVLEEE